MSDHQICESGNRLCVRDGWLVGMMALGLVRTACAADSDPAALVEQRQTLEPPHQQAVPRVDTLMPSMRLSPQVTLAGVSVSVPAEVAVPDNEFRPRRRSMFAPLPDGDGEAAPMLRNTNVWQRLRDYHSHDRVRLLTLWESSGGVFSLQAGKKGNPSLQWTSSSLNRGGATRGLLDRAFARALSAAAGARSHDVASNANGAHLQDRSLTASGR